MQMSRRQAQILRLYFFSEESQLDQFHYLVSLRNTTCLCFNVTPQRLTTLNGRRSVPVWLIEYIEGDCYEPQSAF